MHGWGFLLEPAEHGSALRPLPLAVGQGEGWGGVGFPLKEATLASRPAPLPRASPAEHGSALPTKSAALQRGQQLRAIGVDQIDAAIGKRVR